MAEYVAPSPSAALFAEVLSEEPDWYTLATFLGVPVPDLDSIVHNHRDATVLRRLIEVHKCLQSRNLCSTWEHIATCLKRMGNHRLADKIHSHYIRPTLHQSESSPAKVATTVMRALKITVDKTQEIAWEFENLRERFDRLIRKVKSAFQNSIITAEEVKRRIGEKCGRITLLLTNERTLMDEVFMWLSEHCSFLQYRVLIYLVEELPECSLQQEIIDFKKAVDEFKSSTKMIRFINLVKEKQHINDNEKLVQLKVQEFWSELTMQQFETVVNSLVDTDQLSRIQVVKGCLCVSWIVPDLIDSSKLVHHELQPSEFVKIIGVIYLLIGDDVIYSFEAEGCQTIEAAMLQAIQLKNTQAIELLLGMGCSPKVAIYSEGCAVTNIVNIREKSADSIRGAYGIDHHVCIFGHNKHIEKIVDPSSEELHLKVKTNKQIHQRMLEQRNNELLKENASLQHQLKAERMKMKLGETERQQNEEMIKQLQQQNKELLQKIATHHLSITASSDPALVGDSVTKAEAEEHSQQLVQSLESKMKEPNANNLQLKPEDELTSGRKVPEWYGPLTAAYSINIPCIRAMTNFTKHKLNRDSWYSPPFYTQAGPGGYKLQLKVDAAGSSAEGSQSHISVAVCLMMGDNENCLGWPFKGSIDVKLLNWIEDKNHLDHTFTTTSATDPTHSFDIVSFDGAIGSSPGVLYKKEFASHKQLMEYSPDYKTQYLMEDVLCFVITGVTLVSGYNPSLVPVWCHHELPSLQYGLLPVYRTIEHFNLHKANNEELYTDPFYTSKGGYKMALCVCPNGAGSSKGTHVSVYIHLMRGLNDHNLHFPISGIFTVQVMNWMANRQQFEIAVVFDDNTPVKYKEQVITMERAYGWGILQFMSHNELTSSSSKQYLDENKMCFKISFEPLPLQTGSSVPSWCDEIYSKSATPPCTRTLYNYTVYKKTKSTWWSQPFYSSEKGYKLLLRVVANGEGPGEGTHLSLFVHLMKGEHDDELSWPFNGSITVQLLNWSSDNHHEEKTIPHHNDASLKYHCCDRVVKGDKAPSAWGSSGQFISHTKLLDCSNRFLNNDSVCFKIISFDQYS